MPFCLQKKKMIHVKNLILEDVQKTQANAKSEIPLCAFGTFQQMGRDWKIKGGFLLEINTIEKKANEFGVIIEK